MLRIQKKQHTQKPNTGGCSRETKGRTSVWWEQSWQRVWRWDQRDSRRLNHLRTWTLSAREWQWWKANEKAFRDFVQDYIATFNSGEEKVHCYSFRFHIANRNYHLWGLMSKKNIHNILKSYSLYLFPFQLFTCMRLDFPHIVQLKQHIITYWLQTLMESRFILLSQTLKWFAKMWTMTLANCFCFRK